MYEVTHLVQYLSFRVHETHDFNKSIIKAVDNYLDNQGGSDRPEIEMLEAVQNELSNYLGIFKTDNDNLETTLNNPRKSLLSETITSLNSTRNRIFGDLKRMVKIELNELQSEPAIIIYHEIEVIKNLGKKTMDEITSIFSVFINKMKTNEFKIHCTTLKLDSLLKKLEDTNTEFKDLVDKRKSEYDKIIYSSISSRKNCKTSYYNLIDYINSLVMIDKTTNYNELITNLNSLINPMNKEIRSRLNKSKKKEEPLDRPEIEIINKKEHTELNDK